MEVDLIETDKNDIIQILERIRDGYKRRQMWPAEDKKAHALSQLAAFKKLIEDNKQAILDALKSDLNKCECEATSAEYNMVYGDIIEAIRDYDDWCKPQYVAKPFVHMTSDSYMIPEPHGVVLLFGAWNYPFQLVALPLIGAIAAGNAVIIKPSEISPATSNLFHELIPKYLDNDLYAVVTGGVEVAQPLLQERFDYIFYTGSTRVGKIVMKAAAEHLTPVTLELGGKSPVIVADDANINVTARRIMWGKLANSGQTCIAPDYILCSQKIRDQLVDAMRNSVEQFFGKDACQSPDYGRIVSKTHFDRISKLMESTTATNIFNGDKDREKKFISPAVYVDVSSEDPLMQEEIFGPLLPVLTVGSIEEAVQFINERERPLAFYVFTESKSTFDYVASTTSSGSLIQNNTIIYATLNTLPFGGVGHSGIGAYHGKHSFNTFSHYKPVMRLGTKTDFLLNSVYPPYGSSNIKQLNFFQIPSSRRWSLRPWLFLFLVVSVAVILKVYGLPSFIYKFF
jgi:aldehyde dehydrogenase (NAD+)